MPGFLPVGSLPVAAIPAGSGVVYEIAPSNVNASGQAYTFSYTFPPDRVSWFGLEVLHSGVSTARVSWLGLEVLHPGVSTARVSWFGIEVLRSIAVPQLDDVIVSALW